MRCSYARGRGKARTLRFKQDSGVGGAKYDWSPVSKVNFPIRAYTNWNGNAKLLRAHATNGSDQGANMFIVQYVRNAR